MYRYAMPIGHPPCDDPNRHLAPDLREVCAILALGILRLRSRMAAKSADTPEQARERGDIRLHSTARQRVHANPKRKGVA